MLLLVGGKKKGRKARRKKDLYTISAARVTENCILKPGQSVSSLVMLSICEAEYKLPASQQKPDAPCHPTDLHREPNFPKK